MLLSVDIDISLNRNVFLFYYSTILYGLLFFFLFVQYCAVNFENHFKVDIDI